MTPSIRSIYSILAAAILLNAGLHAQASQYNVTVLIEGAKESTASVTSMNNLGELVGAWDGSAFLYTNGIMMDLGGVVGSSSTASDINDKGQIIGSASVNRTSTAFVFSLSEGVQYLSSANDIGLDAINNAGQILGGVSLDGGYYPIILLPDRTVIVVPIDDGIGVDINDNYGTDGIGQVVGTRSSWRDYPFLYVDGEAADFDPSCYYPTSAGGAYATSINNLGQITGNCGLVELWYCDCTVWGGFIYNTTSESMEAFDINGYSYSATYNDINDSGWLIAKGTESGYPLLYVNNGSAQQANYTVYNLYDLIASGSGITQLSPVAINNQGQIAANSNLGPVLLTPIESRGGY